MVHPRHPAGTTAKLYRVSTTASTGWHTKASPQLHNRASSRRRIGVSPATHTALLLLLLLLAGCFPDLACGGIPECHADLYQCMYTVDPRFSDLYQRRWDGEYNLISQIPANQDVFCDIDNWRKRSEMCGPCAYTIELTSGVPEEYIGRQHCIGGLEKRPFIEESNLDIAHRYNGMELPIVAPPVGGGCTAESFSGRNLTDTIVLYNYMETYGCGRGLSGGFTAPHSLGNTLTIFMFTYHWVLLENAPFRFPVSSQGIENMITMQAKTSPPDLPVLDLVRAAPGKVKGKIVYHCGEDKPRSNLDAADLSLFGGGTCPWWFLGPDLCETHPDKSKRLCSVCPLVMKDPQSGEEMACLWEPELLPQRAYNSMAEMLELPLQEKVLFIDVEALPHQDHLCNASNWAGLPVSGRIVAFAAPASSMWCARPDYAFHMMAAGVKAWISVDHRRLHGIGAGIRLPIGTMNERRAEVLPDYFRSGVRLADGLFEADVLFETPPVTTWEPTPAPPIKHEVVLSAVVRSGDVSDEPLAIAGMVLIPVFAVGIVAKVVHIRVRSGPMPDGRGVPLGLGSTCLSLSLALLLTCVTYVLKDNAGKLAEEEQRSNKAEAFRVMNVRELKSLDEMTRIVLKNNAFSMFTNVEGILTAVRSESWILRNHAAFASDEPTLENWEKRISHLNTGRSHKEQLRFTTGTMGQVFLWNGFYWDEFGVTNDPNAPAFNGSPATLRETNQPLMHPLHRVRINTNSASGTTITNFDVSVYNPHKRLWWNDLPEGFDNVIAYDKHMWYHDSHSMQGSFYISAYQVTPIVAGSPVTDRLNSPYFTMLYPIEIYGKGDYEGVATMSLSISELGWRLRSTMSNEVMKNPLNENMTYAMFTVDGVVVCSNTEKFEAWRRVDSYGTSLANMEQVGYRLFTLFDAIQWQLNAFGNFLLSEYGKLDPVSPNGEVISRSFPAKDYYRGYSTEWMRFTFNTDHRDTSWHQWDSWLVCSSGDTSCFAYRQGVSGRGLYLDGTGSVRVSPFLTQRTPRVAGRRVPGETYRSTLDYYNHSMPWGGVADVIVSQRNPRPSVEGERWEPVLREEVFRGTDYSISMWLRRDVAGQKGILVTDTLSASSNLRLYEDGSLLLTIPTFVCRTPAIRGMPVGEWAFLTATVSFPKGIASGFCSVYLGGVKRTSSLMADRMTLSRVVHNITIGHGFHGMLDDLRVHNVTLSQGDVAALMQSGSTKQLYAQDITMALSVPNQRHVHQGWGVVVMLPKEDIVREAMESTRKMVLVMEAQDERTNDILERAAVATLLAVTVILLMGTLMFITFNGLLTQPFAQFAEELQRLSHVDVEGIQSYDNTSSPVREINTMRAAMDMLVGNMREYKTFLPQAIFTQSQAFHNEDSGDAPGVSSGRAAILFTDIMGSTALWEAHPDAMGTALHVHNSAVRSVISENHGYEVKTIGDSFMVAFEKLDDGVLFGLALQEQLSRVAWPEAIYESPLATRDESGDWSGLRIRIGAYFGKVNVEVNEVVRRCDYFGPTTNRAARLEAACTCGAVAVEESSLSDISPAVLQEATAIKVGERRLKGFDEPVAVTLLVPKRLTRRAACIRDMSKEDVRNPLRASCDDSDAVNSFMNESFSSSKSNYSARRKRHLARFDENLDEIRSATVGYVDQPVQSLDLTTAPTVTASVNLLLARVVACLGRTDGRLISVLGNGSLISWNTMSPCVNHLESSLRFVAVAITGGVHCGLSSGRVFSGNVGTAERGQRFATVAGPCVQLSMHGFFRAVLHNHDAVLATDSPIIGKAVTDRAYAHPVDQDLLGDVMMFAVDCNELRRILAENSMQGLFTTADANSPPQRTVVLPVKN